MKRLDPPPGLVPVTATLVALSLGCGFLFGDDDLASTRAGRTTTRDSLPAAGARLSAKAVKITDNYLSLRSKKKANGNAYTFRRAPRELWTPFRWEARGGLLNPNATDVGPGFFCTELDGRDTEPLEYYGICAQPIDGGLNVWVIRKGNQNVAQQFFPGASVVDFAVEADGEDMTFFARPLGSGSWTEVASISFSAQAWGLEPSVGAAQMPSNAEADFDFLRVVQNGMRPGATAMEEAGHTAWRILDAALEAAYDLDGGANDTGSAAVHIVDAETRLAETTAQVDAIGDAGLSKAMGKRLGKAEKSLAKAKILLQKGAKAKSILKQLKKAGQHAGTAALTLSP